jgi:GNAT superfamily N-acetyltransferase
VSRLAEHVVGQGGALVAVKSGTIVGMIVGFVTSHWFTDEKVASDFTFYIKPEARGGRVALMLVRAFEEWARAQGARGTVPGTSTMVSPELVARFYEKLGYERTGYGFFKEL